MNKSLVTYSLIFLLVVPIFGFNFFINILGNILLLMFLVPLLIFLIAIISFNSLNSKVKTCYQCGMISLDTNNTCMNCGADLGSKKTNNLKKPSEITIEVKAEEVT
tara:strand:- start:164 stop:481 length:318 start_codon:yes stop_codon:yes gene_type:complete